ncbi:MAG: DNA topoisomerase IB [Phenylobacterium sp.]|nr:DNA topoisomerase IB [Phenylobacterium sp.]
MTTERDGFDLHYADLDSLTIQRRRCGKGFSYSDETGRASAATVARIRHLAVPPAWTDVRISPDPSGHIQAIGRDHRRRRQYIYHPRFRALQDQVKFDHLLDFGRALPTVRAQVESDLAQRGHGRNKVLAAIVHLLDTALIRVGNAAYARENRSFGLTTLRVGQVDAQGDDLRFCFRGKSGRQWRLRLRDRRVAKVVRACQDLPGQELFQYLDDEQRPQGVSSSDVNAYLLAVADADVSSKDFRTWGACALAIEQLAAESVVAGKAAQAEMVAGIAERLGNTATVCRKAYIHPRRLNGALEHDFVARIGKKVRHLRPAPTARLTPPERVLLTLLAETQPDGSSGLRP